MTTTVYDLTNRVLTSDSRWSAMFNLADGGYLLFADNTGFHKIASRLGAAMVLAGDGQLISEWKQWWHQETISSDTMPQVAIDEIRLVSVMIVSIDGDILFDAGPKSALIDPMTQSFIGVFAGTGGKFAAECFDANRCPHTAIQTAMTMDICSGGDVMFCELRTSKDNLNTETYDYNDVITALHERGMLMKLDSNLIPANDPVAADLNKHPEAEVIKKALKSGSIRACAPSGNSQFKWTPERVDRLKKAVDRVAEIESSMK